MGFLDDTSTKGIKVKMPFFLFINGNIFSNNSKGDEMRKFYFLVFLIISITACNKSSTEPSSQQFRQNFDGNWIEQFYSDSTYTDTTGYPKYHVKIQTTDSTMFWTFLNRGDPSIVDTVTDFGVFSEKDHTFNGSSYGGEYQDWLYSDNSNKCHGYTKTFTGFGTLTDYFILSK